MSEANRVRKVQLNFRVAEREKQLIEERMQEIGTTNREAYLRKIAIDGMLVKLEVPELKEIVSLMRRTSNNINQIARRLNETGRIYEVDITDVQNQQEQLWDMLNSLITKISEIG
ncbi:MAG: plasmid mobilization relaxosome protein MobC [Clostridia bacterium]|nr:plasmid mobilization relaxosome protein MobC [Clostridia bacterium]